MIASKPIGLIMSSIAALLDSPKAVCRPVLHDKVGKLLLARLGPHLAVAKRTGGQWPGPAGKPGRRGGLRP